MWLKMLLMIVNCGGKCKGRCSKAGQRDRCMKYCGICCEECKCVPSGTYGNKHECPCYRDMISSKGKPKCPWIASNFLFLWRVYGVIHIFLCYHHEWINSDYNLLLGLTSWLKFIYEQDPLVHSEILNWTIQNF